MSSNDDPLPYTLAGKLLLIASLFLPLLGMWWVIYSMTQSGMSGRFPIVMLCLPFILPAFILFFGGCALCRRLGIRIRKDDIIDERGYPKRARSIKSHESEP